MTHALIKTLFTILVLINSVSLGADDPYFSSWVTYRSLQEKGISLEFHKEIAQRVAETKARELKKQDNIAAIAISVHGGDNWNRRSVNCDLGYLISSTLKVSIEEPLKEPNGNVMLAIPDIFVGERTYRDSMYRQNLIKQFLTFLLSEEYTRDWGLSSELNVTRRVLASDRPDLKTMVSTEQSGVRELSHSKTLGEILHCEQSMLFKIMTDEKILEQLVDDIIKKIQISGVDEFFRNNPQITLDIVTYNDMCLKCFATCYNMHQRLQSRINALLISKLDRLNIFPEAISWPIPVTIVVSSFRPFKLNSATLTRGDVDSLDLVTYTTYSLANPHIARSMLYKYLIRGLKAESHYLRLISC